MKKLDSLDDSPSKNVAQILIMRWFAGLLVLACLYAGSVQASTATAYYVLDPDLSLEDATVVSLEDGNAITAGGTQLYLDSGGLGIIPAIDLAPGTRISGTGAFSLGNSVNGTDLPNPERFAGTLFSIPHTGNSHRYLLLSPDADTEVTIDIDGDVTHVSLAAGQVHDLEMGNANGERKLGVINSDIPILVYHKGGNNYDGHHAYPVPPAAFELWGIRSKEILVGAADKDTRVYLHASNDGSADEEIDRKTWKAIDVGDGGSEGRGDAIHMLSDEPVSAIQLDDGDDQESTAFFSSEFLATHFALPVDARYVAVLCAEENTVITLYEEGYNPDERLCNSSGLRPGKVYFGSSSDGVHMQAGARIEATKPVYLVYEDASTHDEKNLLGFVRLGEELTVAGSGANQVEDIIPPDAVDLNLVAFSTEWGKTVITGEAGAAEAFARITITTATGETVTVEANADGSFEVSLGTDTDKNVSITLADRYGNSGETVNVTAVGKTAGSFDVSPQGAGTYMIPLTLPPGIGGMQPAISLAYNSQAGNGLLGVGWSLQGLSVITRCGTSRVQDGFIDGVDFDANDRFCLDGQRLIAVSGTYGANATEYRTEIDSFSKVISYTVPGTSGIAWFRVWTRSGKILEYGFTSDSRIEATNRTDGAVLIWAVNRIQDTVGNYITTSYTEKTGSGEFYPLRIDYTGNENAGLLPNASVIFEYTSKLTTKAYLAGSSIESSMVVSGISTQVGSAVVRNYRITYKTGQATGRKQLVSVQECSPSACLPAMQFSWQDAAGADFDAITVSSHGKIYLHTYASWADVNGDGMVDWVRTASAKTQVRLSNGDGTFGALIESAHGKIYLHTYASWADINGDGMADWVRTASAKTQVRLSNGDGTFGALIESAHGKIYLHTYASWADVNGDGMADWVRTASAKTQVRLSNGDGTFGALIESAHGKIYLHTYASWVDINGDGMADWVRTASAKTQVRLSNGDGTFGVLIESSHGAIYLHTYASWVDINGDGMADWVRTASAKTQVRLSNGDGTFGALIESSHGASYLHTYASWVDINGDGMADWVRTASAKTQVRLSNGDGTFRALIESAHGAGLLHTYASWADINGDGMADWVRTDSGQTRVRLHTGTRPDLISSISNGAGIEINLVHAPLTNNTVYTKHTGSAYPVLDIQAPMYVVSSSLTSDGTGGLSSVSYRYEGLKVDVSGRGMLGFAKTTVMDRQTGIITETDYSQEFPHIGMVLRNTTRLNNGLLSELSNVLDSFTTASASVYFPHVTSSTEKTYELSVGAASLVTTSTVSSLYEPGGEGIWGNVSQVTVTTSAAGESHKKDTISHYKPADTVNWYLGLLARIRVDHYVNGGVPISRKSAFEYDAGTGLLTAEIIEPGSAELELRSEYSYDAFGRKSVTTVRDSGAATHAIATRSSSSNYTPAGLADPARPWDAQLVNKNALGHSEIQWIDTRFGVVVSLTGPNGLSTYWNYDDFGRKVLEDRADGTYTNWNFSWCGVHCPHGGTAVTVEVSGATPVARYSDHLGREVRTATRGLNGSPIYKDTAYNSLGQTTGVTRPYFAGNAAYRTEYFYDALGRVREEHNPDGGWIKTAYNGLSTTVRRYDLVGAGTYDQSVTRINNVQGKPREMIDEGLAHTFYEYDPIGNLVSVTDSTGNISTMEYDSRGRKIAMNDPDMGAWSYQYDAVGQLRKQKDAKLQLVSMEYDRLGRMVSRREVEGSSIWSYDAAAHGVGKLASVVNGANGYQRTFVYDNLGRPVSDSSKIDAETFTMQYAYDSEGRRELTTYPTGFQVRNVYASSGHLLEVRDAANDRIYWQVEEINAEGKVTESFLGNGLQTWHVYDGASGYIKEINTGTVFGSNVQQLAYQFDPLGNLKQRKNLNQDVLGQPLTESFAYDSRNRLKSAVISGLGNRTYAYDALGNIKQKSDFGSNFSYGAGPAGPHAVTRVRNGGIEQASYTYDANGNMTSGAGRKITWNTFNKASQITRGATTVSFDYDADHNRIRQTRGDHTTYYLSPRIDAGAHYEKEIDGGLIEHKHYIYAAGQSIAIYTTKSNGTEKTRYLHKDHLGSTDVITDENGHIVERLSFEAFGGRRNTDWSQATGVIAAIETHHGFTGHEHLDEVGIIHMNGRLYDPQLGRFLSPDVQVQYPENSQSFNRYSYVHNNPLSYTDPSGYGFFSKVWKGIKKLFKNKVFRVVLAVVAAYFTFNLASSWVWAAQTSTQAGVATAGAYTTAGIAGGAASGFVAGGILTGNLKGALKGAATGAIFGGISGAYGNTWNAQRVAANSLAGGVSSEISGGKFADGMRFALVTSMVRVGWEYTRKLTNDLKLKACESGNSVCSRNEWGELRTDGIRGGNGVPGVRSHLSRIGMLEEGAVHGYDKWPVVGKYASRFINWTSKTHDFQNSIRYNSDTGFFRPFQSQIAAEVFEIYSFTGMPVAAVYTAVAQIAEIPIYSYDQLQKD